MFPPFFIIIRYDEETDSFDIHNGDVAGGRSRSTEPFIAYQRDHAYNSHT